MNKEISTEKELLEKIERMVRSVMPDILRTQVNNIRYATITKVNPSASTINAKIGNISDEFVNIRYQSGATNVQVGDTCLLISADPSFKGQLKAIVFSSSQNSDSWWSVIAKGSLTPLTGTANTITVSDIPERKYLMVILSLIPSGVINAYINFNNDTTSGNYARRRSDNGGADSAQTTGNPYIFPGGADNISLASFEILNIATEEKVFKGTSVRDGGAGANAPTRSEFQGKWKNTSDLITRIDVIDDDTGVYDIGSEVIVLGHN